MRVFIFAIFLLISTSSYVVASFAASDEALPIAPRRSDDRDALPTTPFVSLTGQDPFLPEDQERSKRAIANAPKTANGKPTSKSTMNPGAKTPVKTAMKPKVKSKDKSFVGSNRTKAVTANKQKPLAKTLKTAKATNPVARKPASPTKKNLPKKGKP